MPLCAQTALFKQIFTTILEIMSSLSYNYCMEKFLSHFSAALIWDIPYIESVLGLKAKETGLVDITVARQNARYQAKSKKVHSCELPLPAGAIKSHNGIMVASPELLFLELAGKLSIHRLILLGLQLCSHSPGSPYEAITTKQKLYKFLEKTSWHYGHRKAVRAVKYVENGSASIMESIAYMILSLPHSLGGYGLNGAIFNYEILVKSKKKVCLGQVRYFTDLYYKKVKLAVEYDSFTYHTSPSEQGKDVVRAALLERHGVEVMRLSTIQLYDSHACRVFAYNLATRLGKRMQIRAKRFDEMHALIRELLPDGKPDSRPDGRRL